MRRAWIWLNPPLDEKLVRIMMLGIADIRVNTERILELLEEDEEEEEDS